MKAKEKKRHKMRLVRQVESTVREPVRKDMNRMERYSDKKSRTNPGPEYSTL